MKRQKVSKQIQDMLPKQCCNCGSDKDLQYHHIVPLSCGGQNIASNIAVVCGKCHSLIHGTNGSLKNCSELVREGIARAKQKGIVNGKRPADYEKVMRLIAEHSTQFNDIYSADYEMYTESEIMEMASVKNVCYAKCKRMLIKAMNAPEWCYEWPKPTIYNHRPLYDRVIKRLRCEECSESTSSPNVPQPMLNSVERLHNRF